MSWAPKNHDSGFVAIRLRGLLDLGQNFLDSFTPLQESLIALLLMREFKTRSSQSEISLHGSLSPLMQANTVKLNDDTVLAERRA